MDIILAPTHLGLRPLHPGHLPGTWRAPEVLMACGLAERLKAINVTTLPTPPYSADALPGTRIRNGYAIREFNLLLASTVARVQAQAHFPLVIGGDCSVLLGALAGSRQNGAVSLVHIDGHSDFRHPGNDNMQQLPGAVAGMDLALATGRGETLLTQWPGIGGPLVHDSAVVQLGERESRDADFAWPDIAQTAITQIDVFTAHALGPENILSQIYATLNATRQRFWIHFDVDVFDKMVMPAVDSPGSPGIDPLWIEHICTRLLQNLLCCGMSVSVYDPDLDPQHRYATFLVDLLGALFRNRGR